MSEDTGDVRSVDTGDFRGDVADNVQVDVDLLLLIGEDETCPDVYYLQLYDIEEDDWYPFVTKSRSEFDGAHACYHLGVVGNLLYFTGDPTRETDDNKVSYYTLDFKSKRILRIGEIEKLTEFSGEVAHFVNDTCIYFVNRDVWSFDLKTKLATYCACLETDSHGVSVYCNGFIYFISSHNCQSYNIATREIKFMKKHKLDCHVAVTAMNGKLFAIRPCELNHMAIYTPEMDKWDTFHTRGPKEIKNGRLIVCNDRLLSVDKRCYVYEYDFDEKKWEMRARDRNGAISCNRMVFTAKKACTESWK